MLFRRTPNRAAPGGDKKKARCVQSGKSPVIRGFLPLGHFNLVRAKPVTVQFPAHVLDTGLSQND